MEKKYWFRKREGLLSKDLGYGWVPIRWQGYLIVAAFILITIAAAFYFNLSSGKTDAILKYLATLISSILIVIIIAKWKCRK